MTIRSLLHAGRSACIALAVAIVVATSGGAAIAADSAVLVMYHRFGEDKYPSTSVTLAQFEAHIEHLASGGYTVLPVPEILAAIDAGRPLPERTVGITVDDATRSTFVEAWPPAGGGRHAVHRVRLHRPGRRGPRRHHELGTSCASWSLRA